MYKTMQDLLQLCYVCTVLHPKTVENVFFTQYEFSQSYCMLLTNKSYQHNPHSLLINLIILIVLSTENADQTPRFHISHTNAL